jgi:hypothetical protein
MARANIYVSMSLKTKLGSLSKNRLKMAGVLAVVLVPLIIIIIAVKGLGSPAQGSISQTPASQAEPTDPYAQQGHYSGKYFNFIYPPHYKKINSQLSGTYLEVIELANTDHSGRHITIGVRPGNLNDDSGITYRKQHPEIYHQEPRTIYGLSFSSNTPEAERITFMQHNNLLATVSVTAPAGADLAPDLEIIVTSLRWK